MNKAELKRLGLDRVDILVPAWMYQAILKDCAANPVQRGANSPHKSRRKLTAMTLTEWVTEAINERLARPFRLKDIMRAFEEDVEAWDLPDLPDEDQAKVMEAIKARLARTPIDRPKT